MNISLFEFHKYTKQDHIKTNTNYSHRVVLKNVRQ